MKAEWKKRLQTTLKLSEQIEENETASLRTKSKAGKNERVRYERGNSVNLIIASVAPCALPQ